MRKVVAAILAIIAISIPLISRAEDPPGFVQSWGTPGFGPGNLYSPEKIVCDAMGNVYVAEWGNKRVQVFSSSGQYIRHWSVGSEAGAMALDDMGMIYVVLSITNKIAVYTTSGQFIRSWGTQGSDAGQFESPADIAIDESGNVYVTEYGNSRVQKFTPEGDYLLSWGGAGSQAGQFANPNGIAAGAGEIFVMDSANRRVQVFTEQGEFVRSWGSAGTGPGQFDYAIGLARDDAGNIYIADPNANRIQKFTSSGDLLTEWGRQGYGPGYFDGSSWVATSGSSTVYVSDNGNSMIQKFDFSLPPPAPRPDYAARMMVHLTEPLTNPCLNGVPTQCSQAVTGGRTATKQGPFYYAYLLLARGYVAGINGLQLGVDYESMTTGGPHAGEGVDIFSWTTCTDREFHLADWPGPGSGNLMTWYYRQGCKFGEMAVAGYFYVGAYTPDELRIIPRPVDGIAAIVDCVPVEYDLKPGELGSARLSVSGDEPGCNPCMTDCSNPTVVIQSTWSSIKALIR